MVGPNDASTSRLLVLEVKIRPDSKELRTVDTLSKRERLVILYHEWKDSSVSAGGIVRVIFTNKDGSYIRASAESSEPIIINRDNNLVIIYPDTLISSTSVADSFLCLRKAVLNGRIPRGSVLDAVGEPALFGSMIHDLFQKLIALHIIRNANQGSQGISQSAGVDGMQMSGAVEDVADKHAEDIYGAKVSDRHARQVLYKIVPKVLEWYNDLMGAGNPGSAMGVQVQSNRLTQQLVITDVCDIEELIWSPIFGLKGKVDASLRIRCNGVDSGVSILELKTGSSKGFAEVSHSAQVMLYTLLMSSRYDGHISNGLLSYIPYQQALREVLEEDENSRRQHDAAALTEIRPAFEEGPKHKFISSSRGEMMGLVMQRNKLASYLRTEAHIEELPPVLKGKEHICQKCFVSDSCLVQHRLLENGSLDTVADGPGVDLFKEKAGQLTVTHANYYWFWRNMLAEEEDHASRFRDEVWSISGTKREERGRCLSNLILVPTLTMTQSEFDLLTPGERLVVSFERHPKSLVSKDLISAGVTPGDFVVVSAEYLVSGPGNGTRRSISEETWQPALTNGFIQSVASSSVSVLVDRNLGAWARHQGVSLEDICWRIDKEEIYASHNTAKRSLETLFLDTEEVKFQRLRRLIVEGAKPEFSEVEGVKEREAIKQYGIKLNDDQERVFSASLAAKDYLLVLGKPGTGKTTTLAAIVLANVHQGKSVLFCSHTNSAVDNLLCKLLDIGFQDFIRLGRNLNVIDVRVHPHHVSKKFSALLTQEQLHESLTESRVVATTCLGINHPVLSRRGQFDLVVVDEASQILQPICLGPLLFAKSTFVLVGDHSQLPPLVRATMSKPRRGKPPAKRRFYDGSGPGSSQSFGSNSNSRTKTNESLFQRLHEWNPQAAVHLSIQYRMADEIMCLSNKLVYSGTLRCGSEEIAVQRLNIPKSKLQLLPPWLKAVRNASYRLIFIDTDSEQIHNGSLRDRHVQTPPTAGSSGNPHAAQENFQEARIIVDANRSLLQAGVQGKDIAILTPFRAQKHLIKDLMVNPRNEGESAVEGVDVFTIDQYQGRDNKCIMISFVRDNGSRVGPLLKDWRRLNVAFTRAKQKMILVGSASTLANGSDFLSKVVQHFRDAKRVFSVS